MEPARSHKPYKRQFESDPCHKIPLWCNDSTQVFGAYSLGLNPGKGT